MCIQVKKKDIEALINTIEEKLKTQEQVNIVIAGARETGKTTLANKLKELFEDRYEVAIISQEWYLKNSRDIPKNKEGYLFESWAAFLSSEFVCNVEKLLEEGMVSVPICDFHTINRTSKRNTIKVGRINIFEGLHAISLLNRLDKPIRVFLDSENDVEPMNEKYILHQKAKADFVLKFESKM